jgi:hypothetical protein
VLLVAGTAWWSGLFEDRDKVTAPKDDSAGIVEEMRERASVDCDEGR